MHLRVNSGDHTCLGVRILYRLRLPVIIRSSVVYSYSCVTRSGVSLLLPCGRIWYELQNPRQVAVILLKHCVI